VTGADTTTSAAALAGLPFRDLLDALEAPAPSPCGGSAAALAGAMAASLVGLVARQARGWDAAPGVAAQAAALRDRLALLAEEDVRAYAAAMEALAAARGTGGDRDRMLGLALERAADVPLAIASAAADVAELGAEAAANGSPSLQPDAVAATLLAEAACTASTRLVEVNLALLPDDQRVATARADAEAARSSRARALGQEDG
jgi:formiminotetrahydrofolate cyclodeaminase